METWEGKSRYLQEQELNVEIKKLKLALAFVAITFVGVLLINTFA